MGRAYVYGLRCTKLLLLVPFVGHSKFRRPKPMKSGILVRFRKRK